MVGVVGKHAMLTQELLETEGQANLGRATKQRIRGVIIFVKLLIKVATHNGANVMFPFRKPTHVVSDQGPCPPMACERAGFRRALLV
jgi:hypothetical protein